MRLQNIWTKHHVRAHNAPMLLAAIFAAQFAQTTPLFAGAITQISASDHSVLLQFDDAVDKASVFSLVGPDRIALDIKGATSGAHATIGGPVSAVRQAQFDADTARVVFDLTHPAVVTGGSFSADGHSLRLNLRDVAPTEFSSALSRGRKDIMPAGPSTQLAQDVSSVQFMAKPPKRRYEVNAPIGVGAPAAGMPKIYGPSDKNLPLVVIDAGHGGHDPGAINPVGGQKEKDVTLGIAKAIRDQLITSGRVRVALTRDTDRFLVLEDRYGIARKMHADLFISIHADSAGSAEANGATVYTLSEVASDREAQKLASRENKADIINGVNLGGAEANVSSILIDLTQRETMNVSADFAKVLLREAKPSMRIRSDSHKFASFVVLKAPDTPSVLFETGYISNASDVAMLASTSGQQKIGRTVASAIQVHFARRIAAK